MNTDPFRPSLAHVLACAEACSFDAASMLRETKDHIANGNRAAALQAAAEARTKADVSISFWGDADGRAASNADRRTVADIRHHADLARMFAARATDLAMA